MNGVIPNPKKTIEIDFSIDQLKNSIEYITYKNSKYKLFQKNDVINQYSFQGMEFLSLGVYIDINLTSLNENKTRIDIEVRRTIGAFDKPTEINKANDHIQNITKFIGECVVMSVEELIQLKESSTAINSEKKKGLTWKTVAIFVVSFIVFFAVFKMIFKKNQDEVQPDNIAKIEGSNQNSSPLILDKEYYFYDETDELNCPECDPCWKIKFIDKTNGELWSKPCSGSSVLKSCQSKFIYKYNEENKTVSIMSIDNNNVSKICKRKFLGDWVWSKGKFPQMRFYSKNNPGVDFS
jgi:hypothetical protein